MNVEELVKAIEITHTKTAAGYVGRMSGHDWMERLEDFERLDEDLHLLAGRVVELEAEMAKFALCEESEGCYDDWGGLHITHNLGTSFTPVKGTGVMRKVYHKEDE